MKRELLICGGGYLKLPRRRRKRSVEHLELPDDGFGTNEMLASCDCERDERTGQSHLVILEMPLPQSEDEEDLVDQLVKRGRRRGSKLLNRHARGQAHLEHPGWD